MPMPLSRTYGVPLNKQQLVRASSRFTACHFKPLNLHIYHNLQSQFFSNTNNLSFALPNSSGFYTPYLLRLTDNVTRRRNLV